MNKRLMSVLLAVVIVLGMMPGVALAAEGGSGATPQKGCFTINAPSGADAALYEAVSGAGIVRIGPDAKNPQDDGTVDYAFHVPITNQMTYRISGQGYVTYAGTVEAGSTSRLIVREDMLKPDGRSAATLDRDYTSNGGANIADLYMNINAQGYLRLGSNEAYQLSCKRNWWGSNATWVLSRNYRLIEPDFHYTVTGLDGQPCNDVISVSDSGLITAVGEGAAIILVTYDAMTLNYHEAIKVSYDGYDPNGFYGAIWPENTGVFVVSVGAADSGISTGITINEGRNEGKNKVSGDALDAELDAIYFLGDSGKYSFTPDTDGVTVSVANPNIRNDKLSFTGFQALAAGSDGSYTVPLTEGRNIVRLEKDGKAEYQVITAKRVSATVNGVALKDAVLAPGKEVSIVFDTLYNPVTRMGLYNTDAAVIYTEVSGTDGLLAGNARGPYGYYFFPSTPAKQTVENFIAPAMDNSGYQNSMVKIGDALTVPADFKGRYFVLSGGLFNVGGFGENYGDHRVLTQVRPGMAPNTMAYIGRLPDISIPVGTLNSIKVTRQPASRTYNIGDVFDPDGMEVTAAYKGSGGSFTKAVSHFEYDTSAFTSTGRKAVTVSYTQGSVTRTATVNVTVSNIKLEKIEVSAPPARTAYKIGDAFDPAGMEVTATYSDGSTRRVNGYVCSPDTFSEGDKSVTVAYGAKTATVNAGIGLAASIAVTTPPGKTAESSGESTGPGYDAITVYLSYSKSGKFVTGSDGSLLCNAPVTVYDMDQDGKYTIGDAFAALHDAYYSGGKSGYADMVTELGGWVNKFWGDASGNISYALNHNWVSGPMTGVKQGSKLAVFDYMDVISYSDLYTWFESDSYTGAPGKAKTFTVNGVSIMQSSDTVNVTAAPVGAAVTVYDKNNRAVSTLATVVGKDGSFSITFPSAGIYTVEVSGVCDYTTASYNGGSAVSYKNATIVPSRCIVTISSGNASS
jgi:hypothetical protein